MNVSQILCNAVLVRLGKIKEQASSRSSFSSEGMIKNSNDLIKYVASLKEGKEVDPEEVKKIYAYLQRYVPEQPDKKELLADVKELFELS